MRLCMGSRRGFICRMKIGNMPLEPMGSSQTMRVRHRNMLGPSTDGHHYAVVHVTGYIKNWPPSGKQKITYFLYNLFHKKKMGKVMKQRLHCCLKPYRKFQYRDQFS